MKGFYFIFIFIGGGGGGGWWDGVAPHQKWVNLHVAKANIYTWIQICCSILYSINYNLSRIFLFFL